jgi:hypothetical protein
VTKRITKKSSATVLPGIAFEKIVASLQARMDPNLVTTHNETIVDRLGQPRQFDVVVRGKFGGQHQMLGVIECKDLARKVGYSEVDGFITKSADVLANVKVLLSARGFTKRALDKCAHYGIAALSLINRDPENLDKALSIKLTADVMTWQRLEVFPIWQDPGQGRPVTVSPTIAGRSVFPWFSNALSTGARESGKPIVERSVEFRQPQEAVVDEGGIPILCKGFKFRAVRAVDRRQTFVKVKGIGFYDWNVKTLTLPPGEPFSFEIPLDFEQWAPRPADATEAGVAHIQLDTNAPEVDSDALDLGAL